jgi:hypothetical protein
MVNQPLRDADPSKTVEIIEEHGSFKNGAALAISTC